MQVERLLELAEHLPQRERLVLRALYRDGVSFRELASLLDMPPRRLSRHVATLIRRVRSPAYRFLLIRGQALPDDVAEVARHVHLHGRSLRDTARLTRQPLHRVRLHAHAVDTMARVMG